MVVVVVVVGEGEEDVTVHLILFKNELFRFYFCDSPSRALQDRLSTRRRTRPASEGGTAPRIRL